MATVEQVPIGKSDAETLVEATTDTASEAIDPTPILALARRRFSAEEFHRMGQRGLLGIKERVELIDGDVVVMSPIGSRHVGVVARLDALLQAALRGRAIIFVQSPVRLDEQTEPLPDLVLLQVREDYYTSALPGPADVNLIIEVMDTSATYDRGVKLPLYARFGIPEVWLVDAAHDRVEVYRKPVDGLYTETKIHLRGQTSGPEAFADVQIAVDAVFG